MSGASAASVLLLAVGAEHHVGAVEQRRDGGELGRSESAVAGEEGRPGAGGGI
ncbi:MAG: hypothetical protein H6639_17015 [Caldilineaceae bacterium]|nr:hypothetical protein [Caldilineaceae bacterium]